MHTSIRTTIMFMAHTSIHTADAHTPSTAGSRWHSSHLAQPPSARYFRRIAALPSALVVLLSAIALHRVGYGLLLVVAFSIGLAATLTAIGLAFVYAGFRETFEAED